MIEPGEFVRVTADDPWWPHVVGELVGYHGVDDYWACIRPTGGQIGGVLSISVAARNIEGVHTYAE